MYKLKGKVPIQRLHSLRTMCLELKNEFECSSLLSKETIVDISTTFSQPTFGQPFKLSLFSDSFYGKKVREFHSYRYAYLNEDMSPEDCRTDTNPLKVSVKSQRKYLKKLYHLLK